jgi:hypothetical protein
MNDLTTVPETDAIPELSEMLFGGGLPGKVYAHAPITKMTEMTVNGFQPVLGLPHYRICGIDTFLYSKGEPIKSSSGRVSRAVVYVDKDILTAIEDYQTTP